MGDQGNIVVRSSKSNKDDVWFYTHWNGSSIKQVVKKALTKGKSRWGDSSYLARVVFQTLIGEDKGETGFGISAAIGDNSHPILVIDDSNQTVFTIEESELVDARIPEGYEPSDSTRFEDFI